MNRRDFVKSALAAPLIGASGIATGADQTAATAAGVPCGAKHPMAGKKLPPWKPGEFQVHFIYTGVAESMFWIMPDGTTMLVDCGDHAAINRGKLAIWVLPNGRKHAGEWIARYVMRVNPAKADVDYLMVTHHHDDHAGSPGWKVGEREWNGKTLSVSGILLAADTLKFKTCFDRGWPNYDEPIPNELCDSGLCRYLRDVYTYLGERDGMKMEKFEVGAVGQIALRRDAAAFPGFTITNITGNGKIRLRDGSVRDLYAHAHNAKKLNENAMSLGVIAQYGPFRFYTAGDFYDTPKLPDGTRMNIEAELANELDAVDVAKINHHGHHSMSLPIVAALKARVWTACMWDQLHVTADTLERLSSREAYAGDRLIAPGVFPPERRFEDAGKPFLSDIALESFNAGHIVMTVAPGGATYNIAYVTADDESMKVTGAYDFATRNA